MNLQGLNNGFTARRVPEGWVPDKRLIDYPVAEVTPQSSISTVNQETVKAPTSPTLVCKAVEALNARFERR